MSRQSPRSSRHLPTQDTSVVRRNPQEGNQGLCRVQRLARTSSYYTLVQLEWWPDFWGKMGTMSSPALWFLWACLTTGTWLNVYRHLGLSLLERWRLEDTWKWGRVTAASEHLLAHKTFSAQRNNPHRRELGRPCQQCRILKHRQQSL